MHKKTIKAKCRSNSSNQMSIQSERCFKLQSCLLLDAGRFIRNILSAVPCSTTTLLPLVEQQPLPTKSLLSTLFVQPCHSLAEPPLAV